LIFILIGALVLLFSETIGIWFVNNKLILPPERREAAIAAYHFSIISFLFSILGVPYRAAVISHEDMNIFAYVSIFETVLKLATAFLLNYILLDKLKLYGLLQCLVSVLCTLLYIIICGRKYKECKFRFFWDKKLFVEITGYTGWVMVGGISGIMKYQIVNILLNNFFSPVIVTVRGISNRVNQAALSLAQNFYCAIDPQITKNYAAGNKEGMFKLVFFGTKTIFYLMYLFALPLFIELPFVLLLWLKNPPEYTVIFIRIELIETLICSFIFTFATSIYATGNIWQYQLILGLVGFLQFPLSYILLVLEFPAYSVMIVSLCLMILLVIARIFLLKRLINYSISYFIFKVVCPLIIAAFCSALFPVLMLHAMRESLLRLVTIIIVSITCTSVFMYFIGIDKNEKELVRSLVFRRK
jgi:O-antigen/teichoic acid export membrane protein